MENLHGHCIRWTANGAKTATDTLLIVFEHDRQRLATLEPGRLKNLFLQRGTHLSHLQWNEFQTVFGADIHTAIAEHTLFRVIDGLDMTGKTTLGLVPCLLFAIPH